MRRFGIAHAAVIAALASVSSGALAQETMRLADLATKAREARIAGDTKTRLAFGRRALALAPEHQDLLFSVARAEAASGNRDAALEFLEEAVRRGGGFDLSAAKEFAPYVGDPRFKAIEAQNARNRTPVARAKLFVEFDDAGLAPEGIAYDAKGKRFFVGSLRGELWQVGADGKVAPFVRGGDLREVLGLKVDAARNLLWCVTGVFPDTIPGSAPKADLGTTGVNAYDLATRRLRAKAVLDERPVLHGFNDLAVARNGDVYVSDTTAQAIYCVRSGTNTPERLFAADDLTFVNGLVLSGDEATLYVAHVEGISAIDLESLTHRRLAIAADMAVGSIDGLALHEGRLIGVQNSPYLARVVRLTLSTDGRSVDRLEILSSRDLLELGATTGVVVGDQLYVVASAPTAPDAQTAPKPRILKIGL